MGKKTIQLKVIKDVCLGYTVYRGSAPAKELVDASWIDFHDPVQNSFGYQRDFDEKRSEKARKYAEETEKPFWPESILAIRRDEVTSDEEEVTWCYSPDYAGDDRFGTLSVTFTEGLTHEIYGKQEPWRRAFSQVDCQHRLGKLGSSRESVTFCIFPGISRHDEALIFKAINKNQKGIPTSLVDTIILRTETDPAPQIPWAWRLGVDDIASPFYNQVDTGGRTPAKALIGFRGLQLSLGMLVPPKHIRDGDLSFDEGYQFVKNFWTAAKKEWPTEFNDKAGFKMMVNPGVRALSRIGRKLLLQNLDVQDYSESAARTFLQSGKASVDWSISGPFKDASGKGAEKMVYEQLCDWYGLPYKG